MNEIDQVRRFRAHLDEPAAAALAGARARATEPAARARATEPAASTRPARLFRRVRIAVPAVAALAVIATALSVSVLAAPDAPGPPPQTAGPPSTVASEPPTAQEVIEQLAKIAEAGPAALAVRDDQLLLVTSRFQNEPGQWVSESYRLVPDGLITFENAEFGGRESFKDYVQQQRRQLARVGPSMRQPTPQWLAEIDPDLENLRRLLLVGVCAPSGCEGGVDQDWQMYSKMGDLVSRADIILPPRVRAGLIRLIGTMPGATAEPATVLGRQVWAVGYRAEKTHAELYVDPTSGRFVGSGEIEIEAMADPAGCDAALREFERARPETPVRNTTPAACEMVPVPSQDQQRTPREFWSQELVAADG